VDDEAGDGDLLAELAADLAESVARRYRVDRADAVELILADWRRQPKLVEAVSRAGSVPAAQRLRAYRDAAAATKRGIYHQLRRYRVQPASFDDALRAMSALEPGADPGLLGDAMLAVAAEHVSTAERLPHRDEFLAVLADAVGGGRRVVDVGSGVLPLMLPVGWLGAHGVAEYWALDKDPLAQEALRACARIGADGRLRPLEWNLAAGWEPAFAAGLPRDCDLGILLKVVPIVARQSPELLPVLAATPANRLLISGSRIAMAKRQDIERRERRAVTRFCADFGFREEREFQTADEILLLAERR